MARYATTLRTPLELSAAWDLLADVTRFAEWDPGVTGAIQISGNGPGPDAAYELMVKGVRGSMPLRYDVNEFDPPDRMFLVADTGRMRSEDEIFLTDHEDHCEVTYRAELRFEGVYALANPLLAIVFKIVGWRARRGLRHYLDAY